MDKAPTKRSFLDHWVDNRPWFWLLYGVGGTVAAAWSNSTLPPWLRGVAGVIGMVWFWPRHILSQRRRPYLVRWPLIGGDGIRRAPWPLGRARTSVFLHLIRQSDGPAMHNHPYEWCRSFLLWGSYLQKSLMLDGDAEERVYRAGQVNAITANMFHTLTLQSRFVVSIFWTGPKHGRGWGFLTSKGYVHATGKGGDLRDLSYL